MCGRLNLQLKFSHRTQTFATVTNLSLSFFLCRNNLWRWA